MFDAVLFFESGEDEQKWCLEFPALTIILKITLSNSVIASAPEFIGAVEGDQFLPCVRGRGLGDHIWSMLHLVGFVRKLCLCLIYFCAATVSFSCWGNSLEKR